ncbi:hypothetical protein H5T58_01540 [Candidatus Parcubacteria bacterium]|nr:hypothetical protein [Candidatus Parcubacteria bacterium]
MEINLSIFRAYDIRGIYGKDITENVFQKIGFAIAKKGKKYLVGHDIRKSGKSLALALISGILAKKGKVIFAGAGNFGKILFSGQRKKVDFTLFVTASHLPKEWNGLKIFKGDGEPISPGNLKEKVLKVKEIPISKAKVKKINLEKEYINFFLKKFSFLKNKKLKIVLDCGGGATSLVAPKIFKKLGILTIELFCKPDPSFSVRNPEPKPEVVEKLRETVLKEKADFGVAFDGDGDRGIIIDDKGRYLRGDQLAIILAKEMLKKEKKKVIVKTISCTLALDEELKKLKAKIIEVPVGHTFVGKACKKYQALMGVEESSHLFYPKIFLFDDAILTPLILAKTLIETQKKLSQLVNEIPIYFFEEKDFECPDEKKWLVIEKLKEDFSKKYQKISTLDGIKVYFPDSWVLIRASNTSPKIKFYLEAKTKETFEKLKKEFSQILTKCIQQ